MDERYLQPILGNREEYLEGVDISDKTVKFTDFDTFLSYNRKDSLLGVIYCVESDGLGEIYNGHTMAWIYVDKDLELNGININIVSNDDEEYPEYNYYSEYKKIFDNVKLKKGWNRFYNEYINETDSVAKRYFYTNKMSTTKPQGVDFKWYYYDYKFDLDGEEDDEDFAPILKLSSFKNLGKQ